MRPPLHLAPLTAIPSPSHGVWHAGPFPIRAYALCILAGIIVAIVITDRRLRRRGAGAWVVLDIAVWAVPAGIIGARLYHVATDPELYFAHGRHPLDALAIWNGGLGIWGGVLGGAVGAAIGCRRAGISLSTFADALAPALPVAQAIGRLGNYFNQELFGLPTDLPWGLQIDRPNPAIPVGIPEDALFHPTFLYEIIWLLSGFAILMLIENRVSLTKVQTGLGAKLPFWPVFERRDAWHWGKMVGLYAIWYGLGRVWFESIRLDPSETLFGIRSNVWGALAFIVAGILIIAIQTKRHPGIEASVYRPGKEWTPQSAVDSDEIYSDDETGDDAESTTPAPATSGASRK